MDLHMEVGASILSMSENVEINDTTFTRNMGYVGGGIFVNCKNEQSNVIFRINRCNFAKNVG
jgi:hypothetical protein